MKIFMWSVAIAACLLTSNLLFADQVYDESGVALKAVNDDTLRYAGQSDLMLDSSAKVRMPASVNPMHRYYKFFNSKEDNYKNLYFEHEAEREN
jgi:hypothetical protein